MRDFFMHINNAENAIEKNLLKDPENEWIEENFRGLRIFLTKKLEAQLFFSFSIEKIDENKLPEFLKISKESVLSAFN